MDPALVPQGQPTIAHLFMGGSERVKTRESRQGRKNCVVARNSIQVFLDDSMRCFLRNISNSS
jgi:hypothetical protein